MAVAWSVEPVTFDASILKLTRLGRTEQFDGAAAVGVDGDEIVINGWLGHATFFRPGLRL